MTARAPAGPTGWAVFAGVVLFIAGFLNFFYGLAAIVNDDVITVGGRGAIIWNLTAWGWIHLFLGVLVGLAGVAVIRGQAWGRFVGIALVAVSLIVNFMFLPHYPLWAMVTVALDAAIIWALAVYREGAV